MAGGGFLTFCWEKGSGNAIMWPFENLKMVGARMAFNRNTDDADAADEYGFIHVKPLAKVYVLFAIHD